MNKPFKIFHLLSNVVSVGIILISLVYILIIWDSIPAETGIHFASTGEFDVYASKRFAFYPYVIGFGALFLMEIADIVSKKLKSGLKISENTEQKLKKLVSIVLDIMKLCTSFYFTHWAECVIVQKPFNNIVGKTVAIIFILSIIVLIILPMIIKKIVRE